MSELEKMLTGEVYNANYDEEILKLRQKAQDLCFEFNQTRPSDRKKQKEIIKFHNRKPIFLRLWF